MMKKTDDKALDELDEYINRKLIALGDEAEDAFDPSDCGAEMAEWQKRLDAITALRARVKELEAQANANMTMNREAFLHQYDLIKSNARQVTRGQAEKWGNKWMPDHTLEWVCLSLEGLGLEIVEGCDND